MLAAGISLWQKMNLVGGPEELSAISF